MSRVRAYKVCKVCGEGYDAFKSFDARGRYCSPACLTEARRRHRRTQAGEEDSPAIGPAILPPVINLGNLGAVVRIDPGLEGDERRLV